MCRLSSTLQNLTTGFFYPPSYIIYCVFFQVSLLLNKDQLKEEIKILERSLRVKKQLAALQRYEQILSQKKRDSMDPDLFSQNEIIQLLMKWCRVVCAFYGIQVSFLWLRLFCIKIGKRVSLYWSNISGNKMCQTARKIRVFGLCIWSSTYFISKYFHL